MARILICDDQEMMRDSLAAILAREGHEVVATGDGPAAVSRLSTGRFDLLITDLKMPRMTGLELLSEAKRLRADMPVVLMTAFATVQTAVEAMKLGAYDYIQKPFDGEEIKLLVDRTLEHNRLIRENATLRSMAEASLAPRPLVGDGDLMREVKRKIDLVGRSTATVLIRGESGTGKEVVARAIHAASDRRDKPFLAVNCAALSENLLESELFGHEKGAFTGADKLRRGRFELADGGTLLLDEISEIAPALQAKLLRVLQESMFERVGSSVSQQIDVRVVATTNRDLETEVENGKFRQDLFYRLNVVPIDLPPLRHRPEDIGDLCRHFLSLAARRCGQAYRHIEPEALRLLTRYAWPGNVRELQNIVERAMVLETEPGLVRASTIEPWLKPAKAPSTAAVDNLAGKPLADIEKQVILTTLRRFQGHRVKTAGALGIGVRTLGMKIKKWKEEGEESLVGVEAEVD
ncbi:sigma-54-dependent transcriptional regulator [Humisphaera borealis]|uniref:Sigma-54-dependent Fis family transcriptional regulator n=1 Tax=Humisphaera borealis TaxID=2807512 RepID=A0A7M2WXH9_9BACT|nr:sigma-54 dependent transcriptional regulator [Humisphaera borealis]QOV89902.1 sigma-54-dependent Fis family transcriptional regulator [Humisphaera borealis]